jgi:DNA repair protein RadA/Sms
MYGTPDAQVYDRACRMGLGGCDTLQLLPSCCMDDILAHIIAMRPAAVVVDSIQTMYLTALPNVPGAVVQVCG